MEEEKKEEQIKKLSDELIAVIRELLQLSIVTGTNIIDHLRAVEVVTDPESGKVTPTEQYILAYNEMIEELVKKAEESQEEVDAAVAALANEKNEEDVLN